MSYRRVGVVYRKELIDALRDRRTLIAMLLVPILLYPALMVITVQALAVEKARRERETYRVLVPDERHARWLQAVLAADEVALRDAGGGADPVRANVRAEQIGVEPREGDLDALIRAGAAQAAVSVDPPPDGGPATTGAAIDVNRVIRVAFDPAEFRSAEAARALSRIVARTAQRMVLERVARAGLPADALTPLALAEVSVASAFKLGGALLGQILPFLLVVMTITGAIYPAIDLTAGERERGTLETLMVAPVPVGQIMAGKFLVVVTVAVLSCTLNLLSIGATVRFGGIAEAMSRSSAAVGPISIPIGVLPLVLAAMVPFAVLFSGVMLATCSVARSFKEAQNYMTPVMVTALIPAMTTAYMPSIRLAGVVTVLPVANVVVLLRELFLGHYDWPAIGMTLASTSVYAAAAVFVAARLYGQEAVLFSDVGSYRALFARRFFRPADRPATATALLLVALVFPLSFYVQTALGSADMPARRLATMTVVLLLGCYFLPPVLAAAYLRLRVRTTFSLSPPAPRAWLGAGLVAAAAPLLGSFVSQATQRVLPLSSEYQGALESAETHMLALPVAARLLLFALLPAVCEETLFRGFLLSGLRDRLRPAAVPGGGGDLRALSRRPGARPDNGTPGRGAELRLPGERLDLAGRPGARRQQRRGADLGRGAAAAALPGAGRRRRRRAARRRGRAGRRAGAAARRGAAHENAGRLRSAGVRLCRCSSAARAASPRRPCRW
ncbi:MAG: ABC transporter permease subunit/CPBP intramembrane protease [Phycisphaerae bacterium]